MYVIGSRPSVQTTAYNKPNDNWLSSLTKITAELSNDHGLAYWFTAQNYRSVFLLPTKPRNLGICPTVGYSIEWVGNEFLKTQSTHNVCMRRIKIARLINVRFIHDRLNFVLVLVAWKNTRFKIVKNAPRLNMLRRPREDCTISKKGWLGNFWLWSTFNFK